MLLSFERVSKILNIIYLKIIWIAVGVTKWANVDLPPTYQLEIKKFGYYPIWYALWLQQKNVLLNSSSLLFSLL